MMRLKLKKVINSLITVMILSAFSACSENPADAIEEEDGVKEELSLGEASFTVVGKVEGEMTGNADIMITIEQLPQSGEVIYRLRLSIFDDKRVADQEFRVEIGVEIQSEAIPLGVFELGVWQDVGGAADYTDIKAHFTERYYRTIEGYSGILEITESDGGTATGSFEFTASLWEERSPSGEITVTEGKFIAPVVVVEI